MRFLLFFILLFSFDGIAQRDTFKEADSLSVALFERGTRQVNKCTPWHHLQCVYITGAEVLEDSREGKSSRHWWRMSYIGRACTDQYGPVFGKAFEGFFAIPHYLSIGIVNGMGYLVYLVRGSPEKIMARRQKRQEKRMRRKQKHNQDLSFSISPNSKLFQK